MNPWATPERDLLRRIRWHLKNPEWRIVTPENGNARDGKWHALRGEDRYIGGTLGELMDQLELIA